MTADINLNIHVFVHYDAPPPQRTAQLPPKKPRKPCLPVAPENRSKQLQYYYTKKAEKEAAARTPLVEKRPSYLDTVERVVANGSPAILEKFGQKVNPQ